MYFGRAQLGHKIKRNYITFQTVDPEMCSIFIFLKGLGLASPRFVCDFSKNIFLVLYSIN